MSDSIKKIVQDINSFVATSTGEMNDPVNLHFNALEAVFENMTSFVSKGAIRDWLKNDMNVSSIIFLAAKQNIFLDKVLNYSRDINHCLTDESLYDFICEKISELSVISERLKDQYPIEKMRTLESLKEKKADFDRLIKLEEEVKDLDEDTLKQELESLRIENEEKIQLLGAKKRLAEEVALLDAKIREIDVRNVDTNSFINSVKSLCNDIKSLTIARESLFKLIFEELEEEKSRLEKIEKDINNIDTILNTGSIGVEIADFYPADFNRSEIERLSAEINSLRLKIKSLIEKKEKIAMNLKGDNNA